MIRSPSENARDRLSAAVVVSILAVLTYGLLLPWLGFYRDDWYQLWAGLTLGPRSIVTLFSIDRPVMGYTYAATFYALRDSALAWHVYALFLRWLGAMGALWLFRKLWPGRPLLTTSAALLFLVYPGFLQQPNANTFSNHLFGYAAGVLSLAATAELAESAPGRKRVLLTVFAIASGLACWLIYEYMIGLEFLRYVLLARAALKTTGELNRRWLARFTTASAPFFAAMLAFLYWRGFVFIAGRGTVDVGQVISQYGASPGRILLERAATLAGDFAEAAVFGWLVPGYERASELEIEKVIGGLAPAIGAILVFLWFARRRAEDEATLNPTREMILLGALTTLASLGPVVLAGRDVRWSSAFDRYTLHTTLGLAMLTVGLVWAAFRARLRPAVLATLLGLAVFFHQANAFHWARFWDEQRQLWWQLTWRAPDLQPGTVLLVNLPSQRYFEDYEVWAPANLIYNEGDGTPDLAAEVIAEETARKVEQGIQETRSMRVLIGIPRDYKSTLAIDWPSRSSCVHVLGRDQPENAVSSGSLMRSIAAYSREELVLPAAEAARPPERIFGPEPNHGWCWYYQQASWARQQSDWERVAELGEQARGLELTPSDPSEWMPFFQAYMNLGAADQAATAAAQIREDPSVARQICLRLAEDHFSAPDIYRMARQMLCTEAG